MTVDRDALKELAKACPQTDPLRLVDYSGDWYLRNTAGTVFAVRRNSSFPEFKAVNEAYARLAEAASPVAILELLGEIERLTLIGHLAYNQDGYRAVLDERDQLKAENEILHSQVKALQADPNSWQSGYDEGRRMGDKTARHEREQLKAEVVARARQAELLTADVCHARKDVERLDRLDRECESYGTDCHEGNAWRLDGPFATVRDAIDALPPIEPTPDTEHDLDELFKPGNGNSARRRAEALGIDYDAVVAKGKAN